MSCRLEKAIMNACRRRERGKKTRTKPPKILTLKDGKADCIKKYEKCGVVDGLIIETWKDDYKI